CETNEKELSIKSPISGQVVTWDMRNRLPNGRPVQRGQVLMRVADPSGPWQLELHMPEHRNGHVAEAQKELYDKARDNLRNLLKEQLLAKLPKTPAEETNKTAPPNTPAEETNKKSETEQSTANPPETTTGQTAKPAETEQPTAKTPETTTEQTAKPAETEQPPPKAPENAEEEINKKVEDELAKIPNEELYAKQISILNEMFHDRLDEIVKSLPDGETKDKLAEILKEESYEKAREKIKAFIAESTDAELSARLAALPSREPVDDRLRVSYILASEPGTTHYGTVTEIQRSAEVRGDEGNTVLVKVAINKDELPDLLPGATVTAKVYCGRRALGYVLLNDLISFIQTRIIFRYF
ncbi:MAG: HlyD family efflux transporter periplasmic adaptor subunit, partial [Thermoguttaceae bacterium]